MSQTRFEATEICFGILDGFGLANMYVSGRVRIFSPKPGRRQLF